MPHAPAIATADRVRVTVEGGVAAVTLARPDKMNALDGATFLALADAGERLAAQPGLRAVVLSGEGRAFCAGLDVASFGRMKDMAGAGPLGGDITERTHGPANIYQHAALMWRRLPVPVIAAVHGVAFGGGFQIALGADLRLVTPEAKLSVMEIKWGLVPDMGGILLMRALVRDDLARELTYTGRVFSGAEAVTFGLCTRVEADPKAAAMAIAREIADKSPDAIRSAKRLFNMADDTLERRLLLGESEAAKTLLGSPNQSEAVAANLGGRPPVFQDGIAGA